MPLRRGSIWQSTVCRSNSRCAFGMILYASLFRIVSKLASSDGMPSDWLALKQYSWSFMPTQTKTMKRKSGSSVRVVRRDASDGATKKAFSTKEKRQLAKLAAMSENEIDTDDIPEAPAENWVHARRGDLYRALKQPVTIRLDADVLTWFKERAGGRGYQTEINRVLRRHVAGQDKKRA